MDNLIDDPILTPDALDNLRFYKYSAVDKSPLTKYVLRHWWDYAATFFPSWMAPNLITLSGLSFVLINAACIVLYEPDLSTPGPTWLYLSFALGLFMYQTFDNVDGRQARKTGTSSALGHVFDHGIDTLNCPLGGLVQVASLGLGHSVNGAFFVLVGCIPMWLSTWEEYYTGTLYLGYINGPTEGILIAVGVHLISALFGPSVWHQSVNLPTSLPLIPESATLIQCFNVIVLLAVFVAHAPVCFMNVRAACQTKGLSFPSAMSKNLFFGIYMTLCWLWVTSPHSSLLVHSKNSVPAHGGLIEFTFLVVCTFGKMLPRVIISHLTHSPFPALLPSVISPVLGGVLLVNLNRFGLNIPPAVEIWYIHAALLFSFVSWQCWAIVACKRFCKSLGINCLTIKPKGTKAT
ncbi:ethanolaminephosphotransferase [Ceratobasidium sp. AG-I]|nr:ethanolaminephosphotransferase [Ceratobasidium sp. AG-I]